jgi:hypothetical protein
MKIKLRYRHEADRTRSPVVLCFDLEDEHNIFLKTKKCTCNSKSSIYCILYAGLLLCLHLDLEDGGYILFRSKNAEWRKKQLEFSFLPASCFVSLLTSCSAIKMDANVPSKRQFNYVRLHDVILQETVLFIATSVRTSCLTTLSIFRINVSELLSMWPLLKSQTLRSNFQVRF